MRLSLTAALLLSSTILAGAQDARKEFPARLVGHALLPANTMVAAPADAPADLKVSGKFVTPGKRFEAIGSVMGTSGGRPTGLSTPFQGQPVQGFSGIRSLGNGELLVLTDNGFGSKANSPDAALFFHRLKADFATGAIERLSTTFLHDPDKKVQFRIVHEGTEKRYLTGADFDPESIQPIGGKLWIGDEFGPYLIRVDATGKVEAVFETTVDGKPVRSPDHYAVTTPGAPDAALPVPFNARRSRAMRAWRSRRTAASSTRCWKARSGTPRPRPMSRSTARTRCASSNSTSPPRSGPAAPGFSRSRTRSTPSATST